MGGPGQQVGWHSRADTHLQHKTPLHGALHLELVLADLRPPLSPSPARCPGQAETMTWLPATVLLLWLLRFGEYWMLQEVGLPPAQRGTL